MTNNRIAKILFISGIVIMILGTVLSLIFAGIVPNENSTADRRLESNVASYQFYTYNWGIALLGTSCSLIVGFFFVALYEIIGILQDISNKLPSSVNTTNQQ